MVSFFVYFLILKKICYDKIQHQFSTTVAHFICVVFANASLLQFDTHWRIKYISIQCQFRYRKKSAVGGGS